jgi:glycerophosphoryl diester phosphodiesterase
MREGRRKPRARWIALGVLGLLLAGLYAVNASWPAKPKGELTILAHRGPHQRFSRAGLTDQTCTAAQSLPPTHDYIENTVRSIRAGFELGADIIELDIHPTTDGEFAVFHDYTIDCRTEGKGVTREQTMAYLRTLDVSYGYTADGGKTFPLRGKGVGLIPTLGEVLAQFPNHRFVINIKSNDPREAELLDAYLTAHKVDDRRLSYFAGPKPSARLLELRAKARVISKDRAQDCMVGYLALGWSGHVPQSCRGTLVGVPIGLRRLFWGWPNRFLVRMQEAGAEVLVAGDVDWDRRSIDGLDEPDQVAKLPKNWKGGVMTDAIEVVGPALKPGIEPFDPGA